MILRLPISFHNYYDENYEYQNFFFLKLVAKPEMVCLDIGAHIGLYSVYLAKLCEAKVFAFEPTPSSMKILRRTISMNQFEDLITPLDMAVSSCSGKEKFYLNSSTRSIDNPVTVSEANGLRTRFVAPNILQQAIEVKTISVDEFAKEKNIKIDLMKIDAEGAELDILKGAKNTLMRDRPSGIVGLHTFFYENKEKNIAELWDLFAQYDYEILFNNKPVSLEQLLAKSSEELFDLQFTPKLIP
jgi:FkbM family methyltransferase